MKTEAQLAASRRYSSRNKEALKEKNLRYRQAHPERTLLRGAKGRAIKRGIPFDIEEADIVIPANCPILGIPIFSAYGAGGGAANSPSIDRIIPDLGYVKGNIQIISHQANMMKSNANVEQLKRFADWVIHTYG